MGAPETIMIVSIAMVEDAMIVAIPASVPNVITIVIAIMVAMHRNSSSSAIAVLILVFVSFRLRQQRRGPNRESQ
jgi:hypothetical protein